MNRLARRPSTTLRGITAAVLALLVLCAGANAQVTKTYRVTGYAAGTGFQVAVKFLVRTNPMGPPNDVSAAVGVNVGDGQAQIVSAIVAAINGAATGMHDGLIAAADPADPLRQFTLTTSTYQFQLFAGGTAANARVSVVGVNLGFLLRRIVTTFGTVFSPSDYAAYPTLNPYSAPSLKPVTPVDVNGTGMALPLPMGGQHNGPNGALTLSSPSQGTGPLEYWEMENVSINLNHQGAGAGLPVALLAGTPDTGWYQVPGLGSVDLDLTQLFLPVYDGFTNPTVPSPVNLPFSFPPGLTGYFASAQGVCADPSSPFGISLTARVDIGAQDSQASINGILEVPPFTLNFALSPIKELGTGVPVQGTTAVFPYARDAIVPNNGQAASNAGVFDGTYHSAIGINFDATQAGAFMAATVNGIPVDIALVRPDEIIFQLNQAHVPFIGGVMIINKILNPGVAGSTGQTFTPSPDQMESWVWTVPDNMGVEALNTGSTNLTVSGNLSTVVAQNLTGFYGTKDAAGQVDYYDAVGLPPGTAISVFAGELHQETGQFLTQSSGLFASPQGFSYQTLNEPFSQRWYANAPQPLQDTWLHLGIGGPGMPSWGAFIMDQDDGGPGVCSFAGFSQIPSSATVPAQDPDAAWIALGTDFIVVDDFPNTTPGAFPYNYVLLLYY